MWKWTVSAETCSNNAHTLIIKTLQQWSTHFFHVFIITISTEWTDIRWRLWASLHIGSEADMTYNGRKTGPRDRSIVTHTSWSCFAFKLHLQPRELHQQRRIFILNHAVIIISCKATGGAVLNFKETLQLEHSLQNVRDILVVWRNRPASTMQKTRLA